jgi:LysR family transcriptional regulator, pca operon transcriptional activator
MTGSAGRGVLRIDQISKAEGMEFVDLVTFLAVCEQRSFSKAAAKLLSSQPTVSARISALELEVDQRLFVRGPRGVQLTAAGEVLASYAARCVDTRDQALLAVSQIPGTSNPVLRLGVSTSLSELVVPSLFAALTDAGVAVRVTSANTASTHRSLLNEEVDAAILVASPTHGSLVSRQLILSPLAWVAAPETVAQHPGIGVDHSGQINLEAIARCRIAPYDFGDGFGDLFGTIGHLSDRKGLGLVSPLNAARRLVIEHGFIAFLPQVAVSSDLASGALIELNVQDSPEVTWDIRLVYRQRQLQPVQVRLLAEVVERLWPAQ